MRVFFYGKLASAIGSQLDVPIDGPCSLGGLRRHLVETYPDVADALQDERVKALVGEALVADDYTLSAQDEVAFLAPVSGG
jgi:molybdopterin converting factor small subunit